MLHAVFSAGFGLFVLLTALGKLKGPFVTPDREVWNFIGLALITLAYTTMQGGTAIAHALGERNKRLLIGMITSMLPLLAAAYSVAVFQYGGSPTTFQVAAVIFGVAATISDYVFHFTSSRLERGQPNAHGTGRSDASAKAA